MTDKIWIIILIGIVLLVWYLIAKGRSTATDPEPLKPLKTTTAKPDKIRRNAPAISSVKPVARKKAPPKSLETRSATTKVRGKKHRCGFCDASYYDLGKAKIECPRCGRSTKIDLKPLNRYPEKKTHIQSNEIDEPPTISNYTWHEESPLKVLGYSVGQKGKYRTQRIKILRMAIDEDLPVMPDKAYRAEWGKPGTAQRMQRIVFHISMMAENGKSQSKNMQRAIDDWEEDLAWLEQNYADRFPSVVWSSSDW